MRIADNRPEIDFGLPNAATIWEVSIGPREIIPDYCRRRLLEADFAVVKFLGDDAAGWTDFHLETLTWAISAATVVVIWQNDGHVPEREVEAQVQPYLRPEALLVTIECRPEHGLVWADYVLQALSSRGHSADRVLFVCGPRPQDHRPVAGAVQ